MKEIGEVQLERQRTWSCKVVVSVVDDGVGKVEEYPRNEHGGVGNARRDPREVVEFTVGCGEVEEDPRSDPMVK
jgi:hypothetical protein